MKVYILQYFCPEGEIIGVYKSKENAINRKKEYIKQCRLKRDDDFSIEEKEIE